MKAGMSQQGGMPKKRTTYHPRLTHNDLGVREEPVGKEERHHMEVGNLYRMYHRLGTHRIKNGIAIQGRINKMANMAKLERMMTGQLEPMRQREAP